MDPREFLADLGQRGVAVPAGWEAELAAARERWPDLPLDGGLASVVLERASGRDVTQLRIADLALATWAANGAAGDAGIAAFEAAHATLFARLAARFRRLPADELRQRLRVKLFVERRIADYGGFGHLENWLKVTAVRLALDLARGEARQPSGDVGDELMELASPMTDPERAGMNRELADVVKRAFGAAVATLSPRERRFLRHVYVEGRTAEQIAKTYGVHRATVVRALRSARETLLDAMRGEIAAAGAGEHAAGILAQLDGKLDLSLQRVLASNQPKQSKP